MTHRVQNASRSRPVFHRPRRGYYRALRFRIFEGIMTTLHELARIDLPGGAQLRVSRWHVDDAPGGVLVARGWPDDLDALRHDGGVLLPASVLPELRTALEEAGNG